MPGDEIVVGDDVYGGTYRYFERVLRPKGRHARYVDLAADPDALWEALSERTRLVWFETPTNPLLKVVDIAAAWPMRSRRTHGADGERPLLVVDNTFASPALQRPLELGADIVFHSATKYLAGHTDTVIGSPSRPRRPSPSGCASSRTRWAPCPARSTASSSCAASARSPCASSGTRATRAAVAALPGRPRRRRLASATRAWQRPPRPSAGRPAARQMRCGGGMVSFVPPPAARRSSAPRTGHRDLRVDPALHPGRVARWRRVADRAAGRDDPPLGGRLAARGRPAALVRLSVRDREPRPTSSPTSRHALDQA